MPNSATKIRLPLPGYVRLSLNGLAEVSPASFIAWNTGLSDSFSRIQSEMPRRTIESRNGMRQPQAAKSSAGMSARQAMTTIIESTKPPTTLAWMKLV